MPGGRMPKHQKTPSTCKHATLERRECQKRVNLAGKCNRNKLSGGCMAGKQWHERATALAIDGRALIGGKRVWSRSGHQFDNFSPIDGRKLAEVARCDRQDVD